MTRLPLTIWGGVGRSAGIEIDRRPVPASKETPPEATLNVEPLMLKRSVLRSMPLSSSAVKLATVCDVRT